MFASIAEITDRPLSDLDARRSTQPKRTHQPVRRHSYAAGREGTFWRPTTRQDVRQIVLAAKRYELTTRQPGARSGALGFVALEVLELFANVVSFKTGRLDPSLEYLTAKLRRSKDAVHRALKALRAHGFLDWLRRYVPTGNEGKGPQVKQTSNAYRLSLPARARQLLGRLVKPAPVPDDFSQAQATHAAEIEAMRATLPKAENMLFNFEEGPLKERLASLMRLMDAKAERESAARSES